MTHLLWEAFPDLSPTRSNLPQAPAHPMHTQPHIPPSLWHPIYRTPLLYNYLGHVWSLIKLLTSLSCAYAKDHTPINYTVIELLVKVLTGSASLEAIWNVPSYSKATVVKTMWCGAKKHTSLMK